MRENLASVRLAVEEACRRAGRREDAVRLMAVSKTHPAAAIAEAYAAGQRLFGENRVQEMQTKAAELAALPGLEMHLIGPLQNNKTGKAAELFGGVDTVSEAKTAARLGRSAEELRRVLPVLVEVKLSEEPSKHGVAPEELLPLLEAVAAEKGLRLEGLMTVPPLEAMGEAARPFFRQLRELRDRYAERFPTLRELSMGMSGDYQVAVEEGATVVRVGTAIFGKRE